MTHSILIDCEESATIREAFRRRGHDAWSCDLKPSRIPGQHLQMDALAALATRKWRIVITHPTCTRLALSGALRLYIDGKKASGIDPVKWREMQEGARFFRAFFDLYDGKLCAENPIMHGHALKIIGETLAVKQIIQPYNFGEDASKATVLWLRGLPRLTTTQYIKPRMVCRCGQVYPYDQEFHVGCPECGLGHALPRWANQTNGGFNKLAPSDHRATDRAKTYKGIAEAMADQWGKLL